LSKQFKTADENKQATKTISKKTLPFLSHSWNMRRLPLNSETNMFSFVKEENELDFWFWVIKPISRWESGP
jgi:hypothetical protein